MSDTDFLKKVQPLTGLTVIFGVKPDKTKRITRYAETEEEIQNAIDFFRKKGWNIYFGASKFATANSREAENVQTIKAIWLDVDCNKPNDPQTGEPHKGGYATREEGQAALDAFVAKYNLPTPLTVNSGNGIHAYWLLTEDVDRFAWRPVVDALKALCQSEGFRVDPSVMEEARIMRVPGTLNHKSDPPMPVQIVNDQTTPISLEDFAAKVGGKVGAPGKPSIFGKGPSRGATKLGKALAADTYAPSDFSRVLEKCAQMRHCVDNRATLSEPLWRSALSIAIRTTTPEAAVIAVSEGWTSERGDTEYDYEDAMEKADKTPGPHTCAQFDSLNPGGCDACPFAKKVTSPITLGEIAFLAGATARTQPLTPHIAIPPLPPGYYRHETEGGIWKMSGDPEKKDDLVYDDDLYAVQLLYGTKSAAYTFTLRLHLPHDPVRELSLTNASLADPGKLKELLYAGGLVFKDDKHFRAVKKYLDDFIYHMQRRGGATPMYEQFGWSDEDEKFVLGDQTFTTEPDTDATGKSILKTVVTYSPPSQMTRPFAEAMHTCGSMDKWKEVASIYGQPGMEGHGFAFLTSFGSPMYKFLGQNGAVINLVSPESGVGKTTTLKLVNSVYGHPDKLMSGPDDTYNARIAKLGIFNNLPFTADELTRMLPEDLSKMLYSMSQGRGKDRMSQSNNHLRENNTTWQTLSLCSSNSSFASKLQSIKNNPDGELMRLLEFHIERGDMTINPVNKRLIDVTLPENYGWAGPMFISFILRNRPKAIALLKQVQDDLIDKLNVEQHERFWVSTVAANLTGGIIAGDKMQMLIGWDMPRIREWACENFIDMRKDRKLAINTPENVLGGFLLRYYSSIVVDNGKAANTSPALISMTGSNNEPVMRIEPNNKLMFVHKKKFIDYCVENGVDHKSTVRELTKISVVVKDDYNKRLVSGLSGVKTMVLDFAHPTFGSLPPLPNAVGT
jgi:hypothetical protein